MAIFDSPAETLKSLKNVGYITDEATAAHVYFASKLNKALLLEGPAGAGKTELALSIAKAGNMPFIRLQCYNGITDNEAIGHFDYALQRLFVERESQAGTQRSFAEIVQEIRSRQFYISGPFLEAIESPTRSVLLIDEIDKIDYSFEALLLELLSVWQLSIPGMGTVSANTIPFVVMTSNAEREIGFALRRRSLYILVEHPTPEREAEIVARKTPNCSPATHRFIAGFAIALRRQSFDKPPSISEMNDVALALEMMGLTEILPEHKMLILPLIIKTKDDRSQVLRKNKLFETILDQSILYANAMNENQVEQALELDENIEGLPASIEAMANALDGISPAMDESFDTSFSESEVAVA